MSLNPSSSDDNREWKDKSAIGLEGAEVTRSPSHTQGDNKSHAVYVLPDTMEQDLLADVAVGLTGDTQIPQEGSRVVIGYRVNERPLVLGQRYRESDSVPDFDPGERVIGHPLSGSYIKLAKDGSVTTISDADSSVTHDTDGGVVVESVDGNTVSVNHDGTINVTDTNGNDVTLDDGGITITGNGGNTVELLSNGDVVINGGSTQAITDVTIDSTNSEGVATSLAITRSSSVYLP